MPKLLSFSNTAWYLHNYRVPVDRQLRARGWEVVMASPDGEFRDQVEAAGFRWHEVTMSRSGLNPVEELRTIKRLAGIIREERPDVVHTFTMKGNVNGSLAARFAGCSNVVNSIAGLGYVYSSKSKRARVLRPFADVAYRLILAKGATVFQNGEDHDNFVLNGLVPAERAYLIRSSGVDLEVFHPVPPSPGPVRVVFASRLLWTKGIGELIEASQLLRARGLDFELIVAGQPDPGNPESISPAVLESWIARGLINHVGFHRDMAELLRSCHVACFPSKHKEGVPRFLVEAAAAGLPIVTTRNRGCIEIVRDGENGMLVPVGDVPSLADALRVLITDPERRARMGTAGRDLAEAEFSVEGVMEQTEQVYTKILGG